MLVAHVEQTARSGILRHTGRLQQHAFDRRIGTLRQGLDELVGLSIRRCPDRGVEIAARLIEAVVLLCQDFGRRNRRHNCWCWCYTCGGRCYAARYGTRLRLRLFRAVDDNLRQLHFPATRRGWLSAGVLGCSVLGCCVLGGCSLGCAPVCPPGWSLVCACASALNPISAMSATVPVIDAQENR